MKNINLNSDIGEGFGVYDIGNDTEMLKIVNSANIACGFHAGDPNVMDRVVKQSIKNGVSIGAHPGFNDLWGFGRRQIHMSTDEIEASVAYQSPSSDSLFTQAFRALNASVLSQVKFKYCRPM